MSSSESLSRVISMSYQFFIMGRNFIPFMKKYDFSYSFIGMFRNPPEYFFLYSQLENGFEPKGNWNSETNIFSGYYFYF